MRRSSESSSSGIVHKVDGFVWQETVGDVSIGELRCSNNGRISDTHTVVDFITFFKSTEDTYGIVYRWFCDVDFLKSPLQRAVFLYVLLELIQGCCPDGA
jgi:hypothetical protein